MGPGRALPCSLVAVLVVLLLVLVALVYCEARETFRPWARRARHAVAVIDGDPGVTGEVEFDEPVPGRGTRVTARIAGLRPGMHGFHVHEKGVGPAGLGDPRARCDTAGPHFNPFGHTHGGPPLERSWRHGLRLSSEAADVRHLGDLGNIVADKSGVATYQYVDPALSLSGPHSVLGRTVVVHRDADDYGRGGQPDSLQTGNAGPRVGCGVVRPLGAGP